VDEQYYFQLFERGSTGTKGIGQRCGVIDSSYRGEWFIPITNHNNSPLVITKDGPNAKGLQQRLEYEWNSSWPEDVVIYYTYEKALTQAVLLPVPFTEIRELSNEEYSKFGTNRGAGMLGSSGK
jgi:dUTP pyrophosphatase